MLRKGSKVSGRGETGAPNYAFGPAEDDVILKHRLLTHTTTTRGEPPLKKLQRKFISFVLEVEKDEGNCNDFAKLSKDFLRELSAFEIPILKGKGKAVIDANLREKESFIALKDEINMQILFARTVIEDLKKQLEETKFERQHKEECEAITKLVSSQPPRSDTEKSIREREGDCTAGGRGYCWFKVTGVSKKTVCIAASCGG
ncbi:THO complex subunit 7B-like [Hibiscus syriacus]|uniref:THO complex subunit 7B-like n=1 Tax=Hibiscus syriacus TaxID=106335 RepID=UPI001921E4F2|nr:THO complex subunit 7B-like [Hibiscus syriacus]